MAILVFAIILATFQVIISAYFLFQAVKDEEGRTGSLVYSGIAAATAAFLFTIAVLAA